MLYVSNLAGFRGERPLFKGLSFTLKAGEVVYIRGHNGAGKTTLLRMLSGLSQPLHGEIYWGKCRIDEIKSEFWKYSVYVAHDNGMKLDLTVFENLEIHNTLKGNSPQVSITDMLTQIGLSDYTDVPCRHLSAGQLRRAALARLLISNAKLWLLDEPFTALDESAQILFAHLLSEHLTNGGMCVATSHQPVNWKKLQATEIRLEQFTC